MDMRQWCSYGTVDPETDDEKSVEFTDDYGPLVNVTIQPSGLPVRCRVASFVAGAGEGEWYPYIAGDEVIVMFPGGSELNAVIVGRLSNGLDKPAASVGGADPTENK